MLIAPTWLHYFLLNLYPYLTIMSIFNKMFLEGRKSAVHPVNIICSFTLVSYEIYVYKSRKNTFLFRRYYIADNRLCRG